MEIKINNRQALCEVKANIVASNVKIFVEDIKSALENRDDFDEIVLDLSCTESIDSMGITFLIALLKNYNSMGKWVKLVGVSEGMMKIFRMLKLVEIFTIEEK